MYESMYFDYLEHHGVKGQHWGVRRYQTADGKLTQAGRRKYLSEMRKDQKTYFKDQLSRKERSGVSLKKDGSVATNFIRKKITKNSEPSEAVKSARAKTANYMLNKYGGSAVKSMKESDVFGGGASNFKMKKKASYYQDASEKQAKRDSEAKVKAEADAKSARNRKIAMAAVVAVAGVYIVSKKKGKNGSVDTKTISNGTSAAKKALDQIGQGVVKGIADGSSEGVKAVVGNEIKKRGGVT